MLQLILGILKVTGILLLAVLLLLVLALLSLLFVPVRYEAEGKKKQDALAARLKVSWMFRALSVSAAYLEGKIRIKIRVLGITVKRMGFDGERPGTRRRKKKEPPPFEEDEDEPEKAPRDRAGEEELQPEWLKGEKENRPPLPGEPREREPVFGKPSPPKKAGLPHRAAAVLRRIGNFLKRILDFFRGLPEKLEALLAAGEDFRERVSEQKDEMMRRAAPFLTAEARALYKRLLKHGRYLLRHYGPRKIEGWLKLGTGEPDRTAQACGLVYFLLPAAGEEFEVKPDFSGRVLEGDIRLKGHIRSCCLVKVAFLLWRDKEFRKMLGRIKGGI